MLSGDSEGSEASQNIRTWIKYVAACSQSRLAQMAHTYITIFNCLKFMIFARFDVFMCFIVGIFIALLPHQKQKSSWLLSVELNECMLALVNFFTDDEWRSSCVQVTTSVASRVPKDMNSLRAVECISVVHGPTKLLRSEIKFLILLGCFDKVEDEEEVVRQLTLINLKDKSCDLFKVYIYLVFTENWFLYNPLFEDNQLLNEMWGLFL
ncbi:hypothetical protein HanOQP8_Chr08g0269831 [Helianthus annuus]|nr:hypothetical protein HanOQP8_Chr08g0269831 [Helianthus annuus]